MEKKTVLIVDDEMDMRIFISTLFKTSGYNTITMKDGNDGLRKAKEAIPDLIILDVMMPGEGGVHMYRHLKTDEQLKQIPVIMLSGVEKNSFFHYLKMLNAQMENSIPLPDAYLEKPPNPEELLELAQKTMGDA